MSVCHQQQYLERNDVPEPQTHNLTPHHTPITIAFYHTGSIVCIVMTASNSHYVPPLLCPLCLSPTLTLILIRFPPHAHCTWLLYTAMLHTFRHPSPLILTPTTHPPPSHSTLTLTLTPHPPPSHSLCTWQVCTAMLPLRHPSHLTPILTPHPHTHSVLGRCMLQGHLQTPHCHLSSTRQLGHLAPKRRSSGGEGEG